MSLSLTHGKQRLGGALSVACGLIGAIAALQLPLGNSRLIGPGAVPLVLSIAMVGLGLALLIRPSASQPEDEDEESGGVHGVMMVAGVVLMIALFGLALTRLGFLLSATLLMYGLYAVGEGRPLSLKALVFAVLTAIAAYLVFVVALSVNMPGGTLWGM